MNRPLFDSLLAVRPHEFRVDYRINPYMEGGADPAAARGQWERAVDRLRDHVEVTVADFAEHADPGLPSIERLPDAVFCANHALPVPGEGAFVLANMAHAEREGEVAHFAVWAARNGYETLELDPAVDFEGAGDAKWHPDGDELWVGHGPRTDRAAVAALDDLLDARVRSLELVDEAYYHLDVAFTPLDRETALVVPEAFTDDGLARIERRFRTVLRVPERDRRTLGGNCARLAPGTAAVDSTNEATADLLRRYGYTVVTVDTGEFRNSGGSIDCLTLPLP